eukprot:1153296-Pelagomonas_calceolata.AAC.2
MDNRSPKGKRKSSKPPPKKQAAKLDTVGFCTVLLLSGTLFCPEEMMYLSISSHCLAPACMCTVCSLFSLKLRVHPSCLTSLVPFTAQMFNCPFCNSSKSVSCNIDHDKEMANMHCSQCPMKFECRITHLTEPIDVSSEWGLNLILEWVFWRAACIFLGMTTVLLFEESLAKLCTILKFTGTFHPIPMTKNQKPVKSLEG